MNVNVEKRAIRIQFADMVSLAGGVDRVAALLGKDKGQISLWCNHRDPSHWAVVRLSKLTGDCRMIDDAARETGNADDAARTRDVLREIAAQINSYLNDGDA